MEFRLRNDKALFSDEPARENFLIAAAEALAEGPPAAAEPATEVFFPATALRERIRSLVFFLNLCLSVSLFSLFLARNAMVNAVVIDRPCGQARIRWEGKQARRR